MRVRLRSQFQKDGYGAKAGQVIRGNLARGGDGQFTSAGNASASAPKEKPKKLTADELRAKREAEREERQAKRDAEREARLAQREAERQARLAQREAERKAKAELAAKNKKGGGGGGGKKKDDKADPKAAAQAKKEQGRKAEQRRKERQAERKDKARAAERQQAQAQRQADAQQRRSDTQARQQAAAAERASRQQAQAQRQQQTDAQRAQRETERKTRQAASDAARARRDADRKVRQAAMDARRAKLDAAREKMQAQLQARRDAAEARANAKFGAWQKDQASKGDGKDTKAPSSKDTKAPSTQDTTAGAAPAPAPTPAPKRSRKERRRERASVAQKSVSIVLTKREASTRTFAHSFAIAKVDAEQRIVEGIASSEVPDRQPGLWKGAYYAGDIVAAEAIAKALPDYLEYGNIREMHQPSAVGVVLSAEMRDRQLYLVVKVVDDAAWQKVTTGVYKGFSIGGTCDDAEIIKEAGRAYRKITALTLTEISLVDRPANPAARFTLWKGTGMDPNEEAELQKAVGDPTKAIAALQQLRDAAELDGDLNAAQAYSLAIAAALEGAGIAQPDEEDAADEEEPIEDVEAPEDELAMAEGLDDLPDDEAIVAMASRIDDIAKVGRTVSTANLAHLTAIHNAIKKIAGDALCKAEDVTPEPEAAIEQAQPSGDLQKVAGLEAQIAELQKRLDQVESQPVAGGPVLRAADKQLPGEQPAVTSVRKSTRSRADLQRLAQTEPNAQLRAQYAAELAALDK